MFSPRRFSFCRFIPFGISVLFLLFSSRSFSLFFIFQLLHAFSYFLPLCSLLSLSYPSLYIPLSVSPFLHFSYFQSRPFPPRKLTLSNSFLFCLYALIGVILLSIIPFPFLSAFFSLHCLSHTLFPSFPSVYSASVTHSSLSLRLLLLLFLHFVVSPSRSFLLLLFRFRLFFLSLFFLLPCLLSPFFSSPIFILPFHPAQHFLSVLVFSSRIVRVRLLSCFFEVFLIIVYNLDLKLKVPL